MKSFLRKISEFIRVIRFIKPQELRDRLDQLPTIKQFMIVLSGFTCLIGLLVILGFTIPTLVNIQMGLNYQKLSAELTAVSRIEANLAELRLIGHERYSQISVRSAAGTVQALKKDVNKIKPYINDSSQRLIETGLTLVEDYLSKPVSYNNYQDIQTEIEKITSYLKETKTQIKKLQSSTVRVKLGIFLVILSIVTLIILFALYLWIKLSLEVVNEHLRAIQSFNRVASQFKEGQLNFDIPDFSNQDFRELKSAFIKYLQGIKTKIHSIKTQVNEIAVPLKSLSNTIKQNNTTRQELKKQLRNVLDKNYHKLDSFPEMADRIKILNSNLAESQQKVLDIQQFLNDSVQLFQTNLQKLDEIAGEFIQKDLNSKELINNFKILLKILDNTQNIISVFNGIADQTTVLSLNASIEAARVGTTDDGFNVAATQIDELADRIRVIPHDLMNLINKVHKKMELVIRTYEHSRFSFKKNPGVKYIDSVKNELNSFWNDLDQDLKDIQEVGSIIRIFAEKQKALEELTGFLALLNRQIPSNYEKAAATLEVVGETHQISELIRRLIEVLVELNQTLDQI